MTTCILWLDITKFFWIFGRFTFMLPWEFCFLLGIKSYNNYLQYFFQFSFFFFFFYVFENIVFTYWASASLFTYPNPFKLALLKKKYLCFGYDTKLHLMTKLQFWRSGECGISLHCHYSHLYWSGVIVPVRVSSMSWINY